MNCTTCTSRGRTYPASAKNSLEMCEFCFTGKMHPEEAATRERRRAKLVEQFRGKVAPPKIRRRRGNADPLVNARAIQPYLSNVDTLGCPLCGCPRKKHTSYCDVCKKFRNAHSRVRNWLRTFKQKPEETWLISSALSLIRKYDIKPEDLRY